MLAIIKKEVKSYFLSPIGYVFIGIFLLSFSISFNLELSYSYGNIDFQKIFAYIFTYLPTILVFSFIIPMLTMRSFSEERKNGTEILLFTSPVNTTKVVLAKFISAMIIELIAILFTLMFVIIACIFGTPDVSIILVTLLGFVLLCMTYTAFGIFASSLTENQIIAAMISIITFVATWVLPEFIEGARVFSLIGMLYKFTTGQIDIAYLLIYIMLIVLFLGLTIIVLQHRKSSKRFAKKSVTAVKIIAFILAVISFSVWMNSLNLNPIDLTQEKLYTLTQTSKDELKDLSKEVNIYFIGYAENSSIVDLARQYYNANNKINVEVIDIGSRPDIAKKYGIESGATGVIVEGPEKSKILSEQDFYTYSITYELIDITEEKLTNAILYAVSDKLPKVYFLEGYTRFSLDENMTYLKIFLNNEITEFDTLNILTQGSVPEDCDTLVITTPNADFDDTTTNAIINYINNGGNILWLNEAEIESHEYKNVNNILALYGVKPFEVGYINETDSSRMFYNMPTVIFPEVNYNNITRNIATPLFVAATKINFVSNDELSSLNVTKTDLLKASKASYFRADLTQTKTSKQQDDIEGPFVVGAQLQKRVGNNTSELIIYGENNFITDFTLSSSSNTPIVAYSDNKNVVLDAIAHLSDRQTDIIIRKGAKTTTYTATESQNNIIQTIIYIVPVAIIFTGLAVWQHRRRKK